MIQYRIQRNYSFLGFLKDKPDSSWIKRKLRQLQDTRLMQRFKKRFPRSYEFLRSIKNKIKL